MEQNSSESDLQSDEEEDSVNEEMDEDSSDDYEEQNFDVTELNVNSNVLQNSVSNDNEEQIMSIDDIDKRKSKALSVKNQLSIYDHLLEIRIKFQQMLIKANNFPPYDLLHTLNVKNENIRTKLYNLYIFLRTLYKTLLSIDSFIVCKKNDQKERKKFHLDQIGLRNRFAFVREEYPEIIDKWYEQTKYVNVGSNLKKFDSFEVCPTKMIEKILSDKERLVKRTQINRSDYKPISLEKKTINSSEEFFNDDDFYHQLLKQIVDNNSENSSDQTSIYKKFTDIQRMRNKRKNEVDTKASKGRKIRYDVHEKLVNFMAPMDTTTMLDNAKDVLFKSLFGNFQSDS